MHVGFDCSSQFGYASTIVVLFTIMQSLTRNSYLLTIIVRLFPLSATFAGIYFWAFCHLSGPEVHSTAMNLLDLCLCFGILRSFMSWNF